ncbi:MFS transporter [Streptomyces coelicoflavus]|uniref:MFS transporter n=1 Tax=Streptomyces coelicoflavus TaxID=285562 RepID=UPI0036693994
MSERATESVLRSPGIPHLLTVGAFCFAGLALLLPVSPAWAVAGGADEFGAGLVTAVLMTATVLAQLCVRTTLRTIGWPRTLALGALLLGLPALLQSLSDHLLAILLTTALRGAGFGIVTVCGATAAAALAPRGRQGAAIGLYGLAVALPQVALTPAAPRLMGTFALPAIVACGVLPVLALPWTRSLGRAVEARTDAPPAEDGRIEHPDPTTTVLRRILLPLTVLLLVTAAGGAVLTFAPQFTSTPTLAATGLLALTATAALARWGCGELADRIAPRPVTALLAATACAGLALIALAVRADDGAILALLTGLLLLGAAY